jgi:hypothetical protein
LEIPLHIEEKVVKAKFCQNEKIKIKREYFVAVLPFFKTKVKFRALFLKFFWSHLASNFSLVAFEKTSSKTIKRCSEFF